MKFVLSLLFFAGTVVVAAPSLQKAAFQQKLRGYFYAYSETVRGLGGHAQSNNLPKSIPASLSLTNGIHIVADLGAQPAFAEKYEGLSVWLVNLSGKDLVLDACDSRISMVT